jgi:tetratricopeptide (TPR) repeat protein
LILFLPIFPKSDRLLGFAMPDPRKSDWRIAGAIALAALLVYGSTLGHGFTNWDDDFLITENVRIQSFDLPLLLTPQAGKTYQPVREISYAINHAIHGLRPKGYHLGNVLLHALASGLLYLMLMGILRAFDRPAPKAAIFASLLFALHPINVEAVAWAASRKYNLLALFLFAAILCHLQNRRVGAVVGAWLATLSSPFGIVVVALVAWLQRCRGLPWDRRYLLALASPVLIIIPLFLPAETADSAIQSYPGGNPLATLVVMLRCVFEYALKLALPIDLNCRYAISFANSLAHPGWLLTIAGLAGLGRWLWKCGDGLARFCAGWTLIAWLPVSNLIPISTQMADRYLYIPAVGVFLGLGLLARRKPPIAIAVLAVLACMTIARNRVWADSITLWQSSIAADSANAIAHVNLGDAWMEKGDFKAAADSFQGAVDLSPDDVDALAGLAQSLSRSGRGTSALPYFQRALDLDPGRTRLWVNYANVLRESGQLDQAAVAAARAPGDLEAILVLGAIHYAKRDFVAAARHFRTALEMQPQRRDIAAHLGQTHWQLARQGSGTEAVQHMREAVRLLPEHAGAAAALEVLTQKATLPSE